MGVDQEQFWKYFNKWQPLFAETRTLLWRGEWLDNPYCPDCRYCCGPQDSDTPFPMGLLPWQLRPNLADDFYLLNGDTAYLAAKGCKSDGPCGCKLERIKRPVACGLFPLVLANGALYLYKTCPAVLAVPLYRFFELGRDAAIYLHNFSDAELRHIALNLSLETLAANYIDLEIRLFAADA